MAGVVVWVMGWQAQPSSLRRCEELPWHLHICRRWVSMDGTTTPVSMSPLPLLLVLLHHPVHYMPPHEPGPALAGLWCRWTALKDALSDLWAFEIMYRGKLKNEFFEYWRILTEGGTTATASHSTNLHVLTTMACMYVHGQGRCTCRRTSSRRSR